MTCVLRPASELVNIYVKLLAIQYDNKEGVTCTSGMWETLVDPPKYSKEFLNHPLLSHTCPQIELAPNLHHMLNLYCAHVFYFLLTTPI